MAVVSLVKALGDYRGNIEFLWYDDLPGDFVKKVMIGTYGKPKGIELAAARELVAQGTSSDEQILEVIGKGEYQTLD